MWVPQRACDKPYNYIRLRLLPGDGYTENDWRQQAISVDCSMSGKIIVGSEFRATET